MSNINNIKNDKSNEVINPQASIVSVTEINLLNKDQNNEKEYEFTGSLNNIIHNFLKSQRDTEIENTNKNTPSSLDKIFKDREYDFECEFNKYYDIYKTVGFYKEGDYSQNINKYERCILLIKENYLYVIKNHNRNSIYNMNINPENSFLDKL